MNRKQRNAEIRTPASEGSLAQDICSFISMGAFIFTFAVYLPDIAKYLHG